MRSEEAGARVVPLRSGRRKAGAPARHLSLLSLARAGRRAPAGPVLCACPSLTHPRNTPPAPGHPQCETVWDCLSVDPNDRDAPASLPINMSHITPEGALRCGVEGAKARCCCISGSSRQGARDA